MKSSSSPVRGAVIAAALTGLALLAGCGSEAGRSLVLVSVRAAPNVAGLTEVEVTVIPTSGAVAQRFPWSAAANGTLQAGVYLPSGASGDATVNAGGFANATEIAVAGTQTVHINTGAASAVINLQLQALLPPTPVGDGAVPLDTGGVLPSPTDGASAETGAAPDAGAPVVDAPGPMDTIGGGDSAPPPTETAPPISNDPPSLTHCTMYMHTATTCDLTTGVGDWGVRSVTFSPDGKYLVSAGEDGLVKVWRVTDAGLEPDNRIFTGLGSSYAAFSPDGAQLVVGNHNGDVILFDFAKSIQAGTLLGLTGGVIGVAFSSDGTRVVAVDNELHLQVWDTATQASVRAVPLAKIPGDFAVAPGAAGSLWVALQEGENMPLKLLDLNAADLSTAPSLPIVGSVGGLAFSADGNTLAVGTDVGQITLVDTSNRAHPVATAPPVFNAPDDDVTALAFSRDGHYLLAAAGQFFGARGARIFTVATRSQRSSQATMFFPWSAAFAPDGRAVAIGQRDCGQILYCKD
jgi:hypothetical protein